jgi:hypothetical protein
MAGRRLALIIATSQYSDFTLTKLIAPENDANGLKMVLENPDIGNFKVKVLLNESSYKINQEIEDFFSEDISKDDFLIIYFSCHGIKGTDGQLYFATMDTIYKRLRSTSIKSSFVNELMSNCRAWRQILILDCCYSGAFVKGFTFKSDKEMHTNQYFEIKDVDLEGSSRGRLVMTASDSMQYALDGSDSINKERNDKICSLFTNALIQGLKTGDADIDGNGLITFDELYEYASIQVKKEVPTQTPRKWGFDTQGKIIIAKNPNSHKLSNNRLKNFLYGYLEEYKSLKPISLPETIWEDLVHQIKNHKLIPFIGPETAFLSGNKKLLPLSNRNIIEKWIKEYGFVLEDLIERDILQQDFLIYGAYLLPKLTGFLTVNNVDTEHIHLNLKYKISDYYKTIELPNFLLEEFKYTPYSFLADLNLPLYITTNYDHCMEECLRLKGKSPVSDFCKWKDDLINFVEAYNIPSVFDDTRYRPTIERPLVYHIHGDIETPESMVLTERDYSDFIINLNREEILPGIIRRDLATSSLMYVGYSRDDVIFRTLSQGFLTFFYQLSYKYIKQRCNTNTFNNIKSNSAKNTKIFGYTIKGLVKIIYILGKNFRFFYGIRKTSYCI